jgi:bifunctional ADP-heptose synthase (sugar kinase/adenylyltransferase)
MKTLDRMSSRRLQELIDRFKNVSVAVLGDYFLDKYLDVEPSLAEVSVETGKTAHQVVRQRHSPGAAGTVVCNLAALGAGTIHAIGYSGDDGASYDLRKDLADLGCRIDELHVAPGRMTPTYLKPRDRDTPGLEGEHSRYDSKNRTPTPDDLQQRVIASLDRLLPTLDAVIILDQVEEENCGVVTSTIRQALAERAVGQRKKIFWADSRHRIREFRNVIIKANQFEVVGKESPLPGDTVGFGELEQALGRLRARTGAPVYVTGGPQGMLVSDPRPILVPGIRVEGPIDETGAGDSATAGAVLALAAGAELPEGALVGNLVASITIEQLATTGTARPEQLPSRLETWQRQRVED